MPTRLDDAANSPGARLPKAPGGRSPLSCRRHDSTFEWAPSNESSEQCLVHRDHSRPFPTGAYGQHLTVMFPAHGFRPLLCHRILSRSPVATVAFRRFCMALGESSAREARMASLGRLSANGAGKPSKVLNSETLRFSDFPTVKHTRSSSRERSNVNRTKAREQGCQGTT